VIILFCLSFAILPFPVPLSSLLPQHFQAVILLLALIQQPDSLTAIISFALARREQTPLHGKALFPKRLPEDSSAAFFFPWEGQQQEGGLGRDGRLLHSSNCSYTAACKTNAAANSRVLSHPASQAAICLKSC